MQEIAWVLPSVALPLHNSRATELLGNEKTTSTKPAVKRTRHAQRWTIDAISDKFRALINAYCKCQL
eukprot:6231032-Amphidinium_carterae.1